MNVLQWPETSTPSSTSLSCVFRFSGRIRETSWIGMGSSLEPRKVFDHDRGAVGGLQPRAAVFGDAVQPQQAPHVHHRLLGGGEVGAQVAAALLLDVDRVDARGEEIGV